MHLILIIAVLTISNLTIYLTNSSHQVEKDVKVFPPYQVRMCKNNILTGYGGKNFCILRSSMGRIFDVLSQSNLVITCDTTYHVVVYMGDDAFVVTSYG